MSKTTRRWRKLVALMAAVVCVSALSLVATSSASAATYRHNCGQVPPGGFCNPPTSAYGFVSWANWYSTTKTSGTLPVRVVRSGGQAPTAWQWIHGGGIAFFYVQGWAQVKNTTSSTQHLAIDWTP